MIKENNINLETIEPVWTENFTARDVTMEEVE